MDTSDNQEDRSDAQIFLANRQKSKSKSPSPRKSKSPSPLAARGEARSSPLRKSPSSSAVDRLTSRFTSSYGLSRYGARGLDSSDDELDKPRVYKSFSERRKFRAVTPDDDSDEEILESRTRWNALINRPIPTDSSLEQTVADRKPPMKALEEAISDSYHSAKRTVERCSSAVGVGEFSVPRKPGYEKRFGSRFKELEDSAFFVPRPSNETNVDGERLYHKPLMSVSERNTSWINAGAYAAPSRNLDVDVETDHSLTARPTYSRYTRGDPDYFDFDLESSVNMFRKHQNNFVPQYGPRHWEHKLVSEASHQEGVKPLAPYLFTKDYGDNRYQNTGYLNCALRTPTFWANRFEKLLGSTSTYGSTGSSGNNGELGDPTSSYTYSSALRSPYELSSSNMHRDTAPKSRFLRDTPDPESDFSEGEDA